MAKINNQEVMQKLIDELELYPAKDVIPTELAEKVLPVFQVNSDSIEMVPEGTLRYLKASGAGNATLTATVPTDKKWRLDLASFKFATDATVTNRIVRISIKDDAGNLIMEACNQKGSSKEMQVASKTYQYLLSNTSRPRGDTDATFSKDADDTPITFNFMLPLMNKNLTLLEGWTINILATNGVAGDTFSSFLLVNESDDESTD